MSGRHLPPKAGRGLKVQHIIRHGEWRPERYTHTIRHGDAIRAVPIDPDIPTDIWVCKRPGGLLETGILSSKLVTTSYEQRTLDWRIMILFGKKACS